MIIKGFHCGLFLGVISVNPNNKLLRKYLKFKKAKKAVGAKTIDMILDYLKAKQNPKILLRLSTNLEKNHTALPPSYFYFNLIFSHKDKDRERESLGN